MKAGRLIDGASFGPGALKAIVQAFEGVGRDRWQLWQRAHRHRSAWGSELRPVSGWCRWTSNHPAQLCLGGTVESATTGRSAPFFGRDVACSNFVFVNGKGRQDFTLLALRDLDEIQGPPEFRGNLIEFCRRDPEVPVGLL